MRIGRALVAIALVAALTTATATTAAAADEHFDIGYGDTVADGQPAPGAGGLATGGDADVYTFSAVAGERAIFDVLAGPATAFRWRIELPSGAVAFNGLYADRALDITETGDHTLTVYGATATTTGTYSFALLRTPSPEAFDLALGDTVSPGAPAAGAGDLEVPGAMDVFSFTAASGQELILDRLSGNNVQVGWRLAAPDGTEVFDGILTDRQVTAPLTGTYTLTMRGNGVDDTGPYSFRLLAADPPEDFVISVGDAVADGVPAPGAGNLENPGSLDRYTFAGGAGQVVIFDALSNSTNDVRWALTAPDGSTLFDALFVDQQQVLPATGTYTLTVDGLFVTNTGAYSFALVGVPPSLDELDIAVGDTVADGVPAPGAGNLENPGAVDRYTFHADAGQALELDVLSGSTNDLRWRLDGPTGALFDSLWVDQQVTVTDAGPHTITVSGLHLTSTGTYSFELREAPVLPPPNQPPTIEPVADQTSTEGDDVAVATSATDPDGDPLTYTATGLPPGLAIDPTSGLIAGPLAPGTAGAHAVSATVTDPDGATATTGFAWTVSAPPVTGPRPADVEVVSVPRCIDPRGVGLVTVIIRGDADLDVTDVDLATVALEGMPVARLFGIPLVLRIDIDLDRDLDVVALIATRPGGIVAGTTTATVTATLRDGTTVAGTDDVCVRSTWWWLW